MGLRIGMVSFLNRKETNATLDRVGALDHESVWLCEENTRSWMEDGAVHLAPAVVTPANRLLRTNASKSLDDFALVPTHAATWPVLNAQEPDMRAMHKYGAAAIEASPVVEGAKARFGTSNRGQKRPLVDVHNRLWDHWHATTASIEAQSDMSYPALFAPRTYCEATVSTSNDGCWRMTCDYDSVPPATRLR